MNRHGQIAVLAVTCLALMAAPLAAQTGEPYHFANGSSDESDLTAGGGESDSEIGKRRRAAQLASVLSQAGGGGQYWSAGNGNFENGEAWYLPADANGSLEFVVGQGTTSGIPGTLAAMLGSSNNTVFQLQDLNQAGLDLNVLSGLGGATSSGNLRLLQNSANGISANGIRVNGTNSVLTQNGAPAGGAGSVSNRAVGGSFRGGSAVHLVGDNSLASQAANAAGQRAHHGAGGVGSLSGTVDIGVIVILGESFADSTTGISDSAAGFNGRAAGTDIYGVSALGSRGTDTAAFGSTYVYYINMKSSSIGATSLVASGTTLSGTTTVYGDVTIGGGSVLSPGHSPGTLPVVGNASWDPSGTFLFEINDATGTAGSDPGWDLFTVTGTLTITAAAGNPFFLDVDSLLLTNSPGDAANFNQASYYSWTFATAAGGIIGFDPLAFLLDLSGFTNLYVGEFTVAQAGNSLNLVYTPTGVVPEPGTLLIWSVLGLGLLSIRVCRGRRTTRAA